MSRLQHSVDTSKETHSIALESPQNYQPQHPLFQHAEPTPTADKKNNFLKEKMKEVEDLNQEAARKARAEKAKARAAKRRKELRAKKLAAEEADKAKKLAAEKAAKEKAAKEKAELRKTDSPQDFLKKLWNAIKLKTSKRVRGKSKGLTLTEMFSPQETKQIQDLAVYFGVKMFSTVDGNIHKEFLPNNVAVFMNHWLTDDAFVTNFTSFLDEESNRNLMIAYFLAINEGAASAAQSPISAYLKKKRTEDLTKDHQAELARKEELRRKHRKAIIETQPKADKNKKK